MATLPGVKPECTETPAPQAENEAISQAQRMETLGRLVGGVAHDFANLLTSISGYSEILLSQVGPGDPLRPDLDEIRKAANRGARLTSQLLEFTRGDHAQPQVIDLNVLILELQRMLRPVIGEYLELELDLSPEACTVVADAGQMEQVFMNLLLNARDAMPKGGRIRVSTATGEFGEAAAQEHGMLPGPFVSAAVSDSGCGIDAQTSAHVFEPFFTTKEKGTGLGLSTVHRVVKNAGGDVWVRSAPGEGATFTICLPRAPQTSGVHDSPVPVPANGGTETVLVVEDEDHVRRVLVAVLSRCGYHVLEASSGEEALGIFSQRPDAIHLVVTDMVMPKMSGRELADQLCDARPGTRVVFMSGYGDDVLFRTGALSPGMSFLRKPLRPDVLASTVREALDSPSRPFNPR